MKKAIITGADGFVGSNTVKYFLNKNKQVLALDINESPKRLEQHNRLIYKKCNVFNSKELGELYNSAKSKGYDTFLHFAWKGSSGDERKDYDLQIKNAYATVDCLKFASSIGCKRFVCAGSIMEYELDAALHKQGSELNPAYMYAVGKYTAHCLCKAVAKKENIDLIWTVITNIYGEGEFSPRFINNTLRKIINNEPLNFTSAVQNYDFIHIDDAARAFYLISECGHSMCEYLIGSSQAAPLKEFIIKMVEIFNPDCKPNFGNVPYEGISLPLSVYSTEKTEKDCSFCAEISFEDGVKRTMKWIKDFDKKE